MNTRLSALACAVVVAAVGLARTARAQADVEGRNTTLLSTASLFKLRDVTQRFVALAQSQPAAASKIPRLPGADDKLDAAVQQIEQTPPVLDALKKTGLEPRAYLQDLASFGQAITARELSRRAGRVITPGLVQQNIRTLAQNASLTREITRLLERLSLLQQHQGG